MTLTQLQLSIKGALTERFPLAVWVSAEISELKVNYSGHCYLELVEKGDGGTTKAQSRAVIWRNTYAALSSYFRSETGGEISAGIKVLIKVQVNFHELYGLSLQITDIDPTYTLGDVERERQKTIAQLQSDGVWDMNREQPLPRLVQRIAIISSANAAGYQDFCEEIGRSAYHLSLSLFEAVMQGAASEESVVRALEAIAEVQEEFDVVVIIRGGGSVSDLRCFDGYRMASHVAQFPLPILAGIGHDKDVSVVDMVAARSLKTPTAVATMLVERMAQEEGWLESVAAALHTAAIEITRKDHLRLEAFANSLKGSSQQLLSLEQSRLSTHQSSLHERVEQFLKFEKKRVEALAESVALHSPNNLLKLGFAVARAGESALRSVEQVSEGDEIVVEFHDGALRAQITEINLQRK
ncbi:MAG: exodeoxyribonuclease VII large subunit [Rikenellaceae bacterium]